MTNKKYTGRSRLRFNLVTVGIYAIGVILLLQLFNLQIVKGEEYRQKSNTRLSRETKLQAARGNFLDRTGSVIANNTTAMRVELYKTKIENKELNNAILEMLKVLEKNEDKYIDNFPISIEPFEFKLSSEEKQIEFKNKYKINEQATAEETFYNLKEKYEIEQTEIVDIRKILIVRYSISENGYSSTRPIQIAKNVSSASYSELSERGADFPGVTIEMSAIRNYRLGNLASHIVGHVGPITGEELEKRQGKGYDLADYIGKIGLESVFEEYLRGTNGTKQVDMSVNGVSTGEYITKEAVAGADVVLTIDANLQKITEDSLKANIEKIRNGGFGTSYNAKGGSAVVMNVKTGEILSMVSYPDFEPQLFVDGISTEKWSEYNDTKALFNRAVQGKYAPGSIFKMVTAIAGLETGNITRQETINDTGVYRAYKDYQPKCWYYNSYGIGHGRLNVSDAIKHSCNYFFYEVGYRMGIKELERYAGFFKLGKKTGVELPEETSGILAGPTYYEAINNKTAWQSGSTLSAVIGQAENSFSPIQMARYISILTSGQNNVKPTLIKDIIYADGAKVPKEEINSFVDNKIGRQPEEETDITIDPQNAKAVLDGMQSVTTETGGTAYSIFRNFNIEVGGKTGSTENEATKDINAWFTGFAPFDNPEIAVVILVENGGHGYYTAEVARDIIAEYFGMNMNGVTEDMSASATTEGLR